jgi:hypothetical protein
MDQNRFDHIAKSFAGVSRRNLVRVALGGLTALGLRASWAEDATAAPPCTSRNCNGRCCRRHRSSAQICVPKSAVCCRRGGACPAGRPKCCTEQGRPLRHPGWCARRGDICCPWSAGGHVCPPQAPICCPPRFGFPNGICTTIGRVCCPVGLGTTCPAIAPVCCPGDVVFPFNYCCPLGTICAGSGFCLALQGNQVAGFSADEAAADHQPASSVPPRS